MTESAENTTFCFQSIHIDAARNSTDDFNLFHDKLKWDRIQGNPFGGPIALGFQLECLIEKQLKDYRTDHNEITLINDYQLRFSNYQFTFANVVRPGEPLTIEIKNSQFKHGENPTLSNRFLMKNPNGLVMIGYKRESQHPLTLADSAPPQLPDLARLTDRSYLSDGTTFYKRKFLNTGNAKNFLAGSLVEQSDYLDELENKVGFPEIFPVSLISCALLERARKGGHDFERDPMVYTSHNISVDRHAMRRLRSNDTIHLLIKEPVAITGEAGLGKSAMSQCIYPCFGILNDATTLFRAEIAMTALDQIVKSQARN